MRKCVLCMTTLLVTFILILCSCGSESPSENRDDSVPADVAYETSKDAYDKISSAYDITEDFGSDIYEAWRMGIYDKDEVLKDGVKYLSKELNLSENELEKGLGDWGDIYFRAYEDDLFSACVLLVARSYDENGKVNTAQKSLDDAKGLMKTLSQEYSDYEHYPSLKGYYTTTSSFFEFCQNPTGSFEQVKITINDYKNEIRDYKSDLDYIFED